MSETLDNMLKSLRGQLENLRTLPKENRPELQDEVVRIEEQLVQLEKTVYKSLDAWETFQLARKQERPTTLDYIPYIFDEFTLLQGDRHYGEDSAVIGGLAFFEGQPVTVIGHQRGRDTKENIERNFGMPHPEGFRKALRLMQQANKFNRPIITFVDTKGAYPGAAAEMRNQSEAISKNIFEMFGFTVPIITVVIGEGGSGGALALSVANRLLMLEHAVYSVISPEGAASILWKDAGKSKEAAESMKITAKDLYQLEIIDEVIPEVLGGAHQDTENQAIMIKNNLSKQLKELSKLSFEELKEDRYKKYRQIGTFGQ